MAKLENRYAKALLDISAEKGILEEDLKQAETIREILERADVQAFLVHPHIPDSAKQELLQKTFKEQLSDYMMGFLFLMIQKNRESTIVPALTEFIVHTNRRLGKVEARVVSATELTETHLEAIRQTLKNQLKMDIIIKSVVDPDVIGGFYILVDGQVFDGTVRNELNVMKERLKRGGHIGASST